MLYPNYLCVDMCWSPVSTWPVFVRPEVQWDNLLWSNLPQLMTDRAQVPKASFLSPLIDYFLISEE